MANRKTWVPVTNEPKERIWTVENLMEGHEYVFRIMAQNKYGVGEPLDSEPEVARDLYSKFNENSVVQTGTTPSTYRPIVHP